jgi:hypothetical protein
VVDTDREDDGSPDDAPPTQPRRKRTWWWQRPTVRQIRKQEEEHLDRDESDAHWNNETRLPENEAVHLGGVTVVEAFTPSTVSKLYDTLNKWPRGFGGSDRDFAADLERSRTGGSGGWTNLGLVRRPGHFIMGEGHNDSTLPPGVQAVWLTLSYLMPSVAVVCATFTFEDDAADMSDLLRTDFETKIEDFRIVVHGRFGRLRGRLPWSRPRNHSGTAQIRNVMAGKTRAVQRRVQEREAECARWFFSRFEGRFAAADSEARPTVRLMFTEQAVPFEGWPTWLEPAGLTWTPDVYRCTDTPGWALQARSWSMTDHRYGWTFAARRSDVGRVGDGAARETNWSLTQRFGREQAPLVAQFALTGLLEIYAGRLARLRDTAGRRHLIRRPVHDARNLDRYLVADGLDAATITADIANLTSDLSLFRWAVPEYTEDQGSAPEEWTQREPLDLVPQLCKLLAARAVRLAEDTANTDGNLRASAQLRQAIANTLLQRTVVVFTVAAVVIALVSLIHG